MNPNREVRSSIGEVRMVETEGKKVYHITPEGERYLEQHRDLLDEILDRVREGNTLKLLRGVVAINEPPNPPESGMLVNASMPRLDVEAWAAWLGLELGGSAGVHAADSDDPQIGHNSSVDGGRANTRAGARSPLQQE